MSDCKYKLPCGWCDRKNETCENTYSYSSNTVTVSKLNTGMDKLASCDHQWECIGMNSIGTQYRCKLCGQTKSDYNLNYNANVNVMSHNSAL